MNQTTDKRPARAAIAAALASLLIAGCGGADTQNGKAAAPAPIVAAPPAAAEITAPTAIPSLAAFVSPTPAAPSETVSAPTREPATASSAPTIAPTVAPTAVATSIPAPTAAPPRNSVVAVTLLDTSIKLNLAAAAAGNVTFTIKNSGSVTHELIVLKTALAQNQIPASTTQPGTVTEPGLMTQTPTIPVGGVFTLTLAMGTGQYVLMCNQPAHYLIGMHTGFAIN